LTFGNRLVFVPDALSMVGVALPEAVPRGVADVELVEAQSRRELQVRPQLVGGLAEDRLLVEDVRIVVVEHDALGIRARDLSIGELIGGRAMPAERRGPVGAGGSRHESDGLVLRDVARVQIRIVHSTDPLEVRVAARREADFLGDLPGQIVLGIEVGDEFGVIKDVLQCLRRVGRLIHIALPVR
jgi:hypothetical protein